MRALAALVLLLGVGCSLVNQNQANGPPVIERSQADTLSVRRGGRVSLSITAVDPDDDPLYFLWRAYSVSPVVAQAIANLGGSQFNTTEQLRSLDGLLRLAIPVGGLTDSTSASVAWVAPTAESTTTQFLLAVTVRDRACDAVVYAAERAACEAEAPRQVRIFRVTVTQRPPTVKVPADTSFSFRVPEFALLATANDPDGDPLTLTWRQVAGPMPLGLKPEKVGAFGSRLRMTAVVPGAYTVALVASDGADSSSATAQIQVYADPEPPAEGMVEFTLTSGQTFAMDAYEYPGQRGTSPLLVSSWFEAARRCAAAGRRLCGPDEWQQACGGPGGQRYSSTDSLESAQALTGGSAGYGYRFCNGQGSAASGTADELAAALAPSGSFANCSRREYGVYDLSGNAPEWLGQRDGNGQWVGAFSPSAANQWPPTPCATLEVLSPLPAGSDPTDPGLDVPLGTDFDGYRVGGRGFRCCR